MLGLLNHRIQHIHYYTAHRGKVAVTAAAATATSITIETKQLGDAGLDNFNQGEQNLEKYSGDLVSLVKAEMERKQDFSKKVLPKAVDAGKAASGIYNGASLAADALSIQGGAESVADELNSNTQSSSNSSNSENGMSGSVVKICSGTGAQKGGC